MNIQLSKELEQFVHDAVRAGRYAREDDVISDALTRLKQAMPEGAPAPGVSDQTAAPQPILDMVDELRKKVPPAEWDRLPVDGAAQHDHYIYGTPKRPSA
jgi:Arc/MetJ-type ribon-helix-helix transcriptional regulator